MFQQVVLTGKIELLENTVKELESLSKEPLQLHFSEASTDEELIRRIEKADAVILGWGNRLSREVLSQCPKIRYIGMCASSQHLIDTDFCLEKGIETRFVESYGSEATVEFIFSELLCLYRNQKSIPFDTRPRELSGKTIGLVGVGDIGQRMIRRAQAFEMNVIYSARSEKKDLAKKNCEFMSLVELVRKADIVSLHLPRGLNLLTKEILRK